MLCQCVPHGDLQIDMPDGRVMVRLGRAAESEFPAPMLRSPMCSTLVDVDVALGPGSVASVVRYGYWKKKAVVVQYTSNSLQTARRIFITRGSTTGYCMG